MPWLLSFYVCRILIRKGMTKLRQIMQIAWENKCIVILSFNGFSKVILNPWVSFRFLPCIFNFSKRNEIWALGKEMQNVSFAIVKYAITRISSRKVYNKANVSVIHQNISGNCKRTFMNLHQFFSSWQIIAQVMYIGIIWYQVSQF